MFYGDEIEIGGILELKGRNLEEGIKQLEASTIDLDTALRTIDSSPKKYAYLIGTRTVPSVKSIIQVAQVRFAKKSYKLENHNGRHIITV